MFFCSSWFSISHMKALAISGPSGEPMATPSVCSLSSPLNWNGWFEVAIFSNSVS